MTEKSAQKSPSTYTRVIDKDLTQAIQEISITIAWSPLVKPSLQNQFSLCSSFISFQHVL